MTEPLDFYAGERHYIDHLLPLYRALPDDRRGDFYAGARRHADAYAADRGLHAIPVLQPPAGSTPIVVASYGDARAAHGRPIALLEHGAGQHYSTGNPAYSGGVDRGDVGLFLCPSETVAARNRQVYPDAEFAVVGCPKLDPWHRRSGCSCPASEYGGGLLPGPIMEISCDWHGELSPLSAGSPDRPVVAISFHWPTPGPPEAGNAFGHFRPAFRELVAEFPTVLGHAHPRFFGTVRPYYEAAGIRPVRDFAEILDLADVYVCDNSSTIYEFASTDRPVVLMNSPKYRRGVDHGLRFWDLATVGLQVDTPTALAETVRLAVADPDVVASERRRCVAEVYASADGTATEKAVAALCAWQPDPSRVRRISKG